MFGRWIGGHKFEEVRHVHSTTKKVEVLTTVLNEKLDEFCPTKKVKIFNNDKEFMTDKLQKIRRIKAKEYRRHGRSEKFKSLERKYKEVKRKILRSF